MYTGNIEYIRFEFKEVKRLKSYTVYCQDWSCRVNRIPSTIRLEPFRGLSDSTGITHYLRAKEPTRWAEKTLSGIRPIEVKNASYSDLRTGNKKELLLCQFSDGGDQLVIDYFRGFYPKYPAIREDIIRNHKFKF